MDKGPKMISKELLQDVLDMKNINISYVDADSENNICYGLTWKYSETINIYELTHKCKEWALNQDYVIKTFYDHDGSAFANISSGIISLVEIKQMTHKSDTEPAAVFKACEWILKEQDVN